jgi:hypothetical protein
MHNPTPQTIAVLGILYSRHGRTMVASSDIDEAIRSLPNGARLDTAAQERLRSDVAAWLAKDFESLIGFDDSLALTPEEDAQLLELLRTRSEGRALERQDLSMVTRQFLEDVLAEASIPDELLEAIVEAYVRRGSLTMSEDGTRYIITLT